MMLLKAVQSLRFDRDCSGVLNAIPASKTTQFLALTDEAHISLAIAERCQDALPEPVRRRLNDCAARSAVRHVRIVETHREIAAALAERGVEFVVLKGLTHTAFWNGDLRQRPQYDVDLYVRPESAALATAAVASIGYKTCEGESKGSDHLPVMVRRTGWRWRGDYYDPDQPLALEIHFRFCNPNLGFKAWGEERFWERRQIETVDGIALPALCPVDRLRYAAWHAVRHLLRGSLRILHIYELAHFLHHSSDDKKFWIEWREEGATQDRVAELIAFRLACEWFGCNTHPIVQEALRALPACIGRWFELFAFSPITGVTSPNKDEVFLRLCLQDGVHAAGTRLLPKRLPAFLLDAHDREENLLLRARRSASRIWFIASRTAHHARTLPPLIGSGVRWWWHKLPE